MKRFSFVLFVLLLAVPATADSTWEALVDDKGAVSMVHVPHGSEWIELVNETDGSFHTYLFREIARTPWYIITEDPTRSLLFWIPRHNSVRLLFMESSGRPVIWGGAFHLESHGWSLPEDPIALLTSKPSLWTEAGVNIGKDYATEPVMVK